MQEGVVTPGSPLPRCHCPCALCCSCPVGPAPPAPYHEVPFGTAPPPNPVRVNPHIPQALPAGNGYPGPDCQFGPVRIHVQHWERIAAAVVAADTSPNVPLLRGCGRECKTIPGAALSIPVPRPCISSVPSLLAPGWGWGQFSASPPAVHPCPLSPFPWGWNCLCPSRAIPGTAELLDCWKLSRKEALFPLDLPGGTFTSGGCHGGHLPGTNTSRCVDYFS